MSRLGQLGQDVCERPAPREASCRLVESQKNCRGALRAEPWNQDTQPRRQFVPQFDVSRSYRGPRFPSSSRRTLLSPNRTHLSASLYPSFLGTNRPTMLFDCFHSLQWRLPSPHPAAPRPSPLPYADSRHFAGRTATPRQLSTVFRQQIQPAPKAEHREHAERADYAARARERDLAGDAVLAQARRPAHVPRPRCTRRVLSAGQVCRLSPGQPVHEQHGPIQMLLGQPD